MNNLQDILRRISAVFEAFLTEHPDIREFTDDFAGQFSLFWDEVSQNTPISFKLVLVGLVALFVSLIIARVFVDSSMMTWVLKVLPKSFYRKTIIKRAERCSWGRAS